MMYAQIPLPNEPAHPNRRSSVGTVNTRYHQNKGFSRRKQAGHVVYKSSMDKGSKLTFVEV